MKMAGDGNPERSRVQENRSRRRDWRLWGPYLGERAWGTVREDYSGDGEAWESFSRDQARSRAYRWTEDGLGGICDRGQRLCLALALWNGRDPFLKERPFGLTNREGNHGEDLKDLFFFLEGTPTASFLRYLYKYPQKIFPYEQLKRENAARTVLDPPFSILDTGVFDGEAYFDVVIDYAKKDAEEIYIRIRAFNRGKEAAPLHVLPTLWFRNTWSWGDPWGPRPGLRLRSPLPGASWSVEANHPGWEDYVLSGREGARLLFTGNETNARKLWGTENGSPWVKDAFHRYVVDGEKDAVNPAMEGTRMAAWYRFDVPPDSAVEMELQLARAGQKRCFEDFDRVLRAREKEAGLFFRDLIPSADPEERDLFRQAMAGMVWNQQYYHFDVARWFDGDVIPPEEGHDRVRNAGWRHLKADDVISMPDGWEYPWFASWDLAFQALTWAMLDPNFAKEQLELILSSRFIHPKGQIPAYEWAFDDVNPPVHAFAALEVFRMEREREGRSDTGFLHRVFNKLLLNYAWWLNRKDREGLNLFEGGFLGLDNISVYNRSQPPGEGFRLKQADATGWMAMFSLNMTLIALELAVEDRNYEEIAVQCYRQFLAISRAIAGFVPRTIALWDDEDGFFKDLLVGPDGQIHRIDVYSWVGIIPLFATEILEPRLMENVPAFRALLDEVGGGVFDGQAICACPRMTNDRGEHLLSLVRPAMLPRILERLFDENQFLSPHGIRSVSKVHAEGKGMADLPGLGEAFLKYSPGESPSRLFGGNSNWRGPVWFPTNYLLVRTLLRFHRYLGPNFVFSVPCREGEMNLKEAAGILCDGLIGIFLRDERGKRPLFPDGSPFQDLPHWRDLILFREFFHGETGQGLGASHQTGWTGLVTNLISERERMAKGG